MAIAGDVKVKEEKRKRFFDHFDFDFEMSNRRRSTSTQPKKKKKKNSTPRPSTSPLLLLLSSQGWYNTLKKSVLTPPDAVFGPVWTVLYIMMGISSVQAFKAGARGAPLVLYGAQLAVRREIGVVIGRERKREDEQNEPCRSANGAAAQGGGKKGEREKTRRKKPRKRAKEEEVFPPHIFLFPF